jgi:ribosomal protein S11
MRKDEVFDNKNPEHIAKIRKTYNNTIVKVNPSLEKTFELFEKETI